MGHWNPIFARHNNDWEMREVEALFKRLHKHVLRRDNVLVMTWRASKKGFSIVKSFNSSLALCSTKVFPSCKVLGY